MFTDPFLMICERQNAATFLRRCAQMMPEYEAKLLEAAGYYDQVAADPNGLWQRLGLYENGQEKFREPDTRSILAAQILRRLIWEEKAVCCLESILEKAPGSFLLGN
jgi:hypothetical protein